ncbi:GNAT family N-acetyltransferase [Undibacterium sp. TC4M20W]|uniref:GNAT family N-acetyltransferase n=1 Tax=Undibacterium sp. TC4M20W TaxID=3413052 RepID=UPI003BF36790
MKFKDLATTDINTLLDMLLDLGKSDGIAEIRTDAAALELALFGNHPAISAKFAMVDEAVAGFVIYSWKWGTFTGVRDMYMQAIYVQPEFRRQGFGLSIMQHLAGIAVDAGCSKIEWLTVKDKQMSKEFYDSIGAVEASHMIVRRVQGEALRRLAGL